MIDVLKLDVEGLDCDILNELMTHFEEWGVMVKPRRIIYEGHTWTWPESDHINEWLTGTYNYRIVKDIPSRQRVWSFAEGTVKDLVLELAPEEEALKKKILVEMFSGESTADNTT